MYFYLLIVGGYGLLGTNIWEIEKCIQTFFINLIKRTQLEYRSIHSFHWHVLNVMIPRSSQELLPFLSYELFPATLLHQVFSILPHLILPSIS